MTPFTHAKKRNQGLAALLLTALLGCEIGAADSKLADAIEKQDKVAVSKLLTAKTEINAPQKDGMTALHWAVYQDEVKLVRKLVDAGADVTRKNRYGVTPLSLACTNGNGQVVELLLAKGANATDTLLGGETALMTAARTGRVGPVKALLARGANVNARERKQQTALMWAAAEGHSKVVSLLLEAGADFRAPLDSGYTPLTFAVRQGHTHVVERLLEAGADVNAAMEPKRGSGRSVDRGTSPLVLALENGHFDLAVRLLEAGANPNDDRTGFTPLHTLSWVRKPPIGDGIDGEPPPIGSGKRTSLQMAKALVEHGADVNYPKPESGGRGKFGKRGSTPFLCAAGTGDVPLMKVLLQLGADPNTPNELGWTPLMLAAGMGTGSSGDSAGTEAECLEAVKLLVELGADVNAVDRNGETAMHGAAYKMMPSVVQYLHDQGADVKVWSKVAKNGRMPLWIAQGYRGGGNFKPSYETVAVLKKLLVDQGMTPPPPPKRKREKGYRAN